MTFSSTLYSFSGCFLLSQETLFSYVRQNLCTHLEKEWGSAELMEDLRLLWMQVGFSLLLISVNNQVISTLDSLLVLLHSLLMITEDKTTEPLGFFLFTFVQIYPVSKKTAPLLKFCGRQPLEQLLTLRSLWYVYASFECPKHFLNPFFTSCFIVWVIRKKKNRLAAGCKPEDLSNWRDRNSSQLPFFLSYLRIR